MATKLSYKHATNKKRSRYSIFNFYDNKETIIGLGGPDVIDYVSFLKQQGFKNIYIYENNIDIFINQLSQADQIEGIKLHFNDILQAPIVEGAIYDLDFNQSIASVDEHIEKFKNNRIILTVALRPYTLLNTLRLFLYLMGEHGKIDLFAGKITCDSGNTYGFHKYHDSSVNMLTIFTINNSKTKKDVKIKWL